MDRLGGAAQLRIVGLAELQSGRDPPAARSVSGAARRPPGEASGCRRAWRASVAQLATGPIVGPRRPRAVASGHAADPTADRRRRPAQAPRDRPKGIAGGDPGADLLALDQRQPQRPAPPAPRASRRPATRPREHPTHRPLGRSQGPGDHRTSLAAGDPIEHLELLRPRQTVAKRANSPPHPSPPFRSTQHRCCVDRWRPPTQWVPNPGRYP